MFAIYFSQTRMMVKQSLQNIQILLKMVKAVIFQLIHSLQKLRRSEVYFPSVMYLVNLTIQIIIYLSIPSLKMLQIQSLITNSVPIFILSAYFLLVLLQIIVFMLRKQQLYLSQQLSFFRFIVSPLLTLTLLHVVRYHTFPIPLGLFLFIANKTASSLLSRAILYEIHRNYTLNIMQTSIIFEFDTFETLLIANCFISQGYLQIIFSILTLSSCLLTAFKHFIRTESNDNEYRILHFANTIHILFSFYLVIFLLLNSLTSEYFYASLLPLLFSAFFLIYSKFKSSRNNIAQALINELPFDQFIQSIDCFLILTHQESSNKRNLINYIYAIVSQHQSKCLMPGCQLLSPSTQQQLKSMSQKSIQQLTHKIMKKIQWILQEYHSKSSDDLIISFTYLKFYAQYLQIRVKMQNLLNEIDQSELSWPYQLEYSKYKNACEGIQNIDNIDVIKDEELYVQFQNTMILTLNCMIEFWSQFNEEKVDLGKIMQISAKLFPFKARIQEMFQNQIKIQKFTTFQIMKLYSLYQQKILNRYEYAAKVQDIITILANRLKDKQDIQYLSKESEAGFIVICLSQSKLGDIFMVNEKACDIFRYSRKEMLGLRVNTIMPSVFADIHDQILVDFLKKKRKKFNTDQRLLFGKDGNGYLFPLLLQLQRASFSSNDQYIFIASVAPCKLRSAPIFCIIDHQGCITDYTASFRNIFFSSNKKSYNKNIQEIVPGYFDDGYSQKTTNVRTFTSYLRNKKLGEVQVRFEITPIVVKTIHEGYLAKISYNNQKTLSFYKNLYLTDTFKNLLTKNEIKCTQNSYNHLSNTYQFEKIPHAVDFRAKSHEFTLPFLSYEDMAIFANSTEVKQYGKNIKTIRYINNHFQRIDDDHSFHSDSYIDEEKVDIRAKIDELKHKFSRKQQKSLTNSYKVIVNAFIIVLLVICLFIYDIYINEVNEQEQFLSFFDSQKQILYYLPQYIISFTCAQAGINQPFFSNHLLEIKPILINNILNSNIDQKYKQDIMKIIYLKSPNDLVGLLQTNTFSLEQSDSQVLTMLRILWGLLIGVTFLLLFSFFLMFYHFNQVLFSIYMLFLSLKQSSIKRIQQSCRYLIDKIYFQSQSNVEKEQQKKGNEDDEENEIEKIKQFKNMTRKQDIFTFLKMTIPLLLILSFIFVMLFLSGSQFELYQTMKIQHNTMFQSIPTSSIEIAKLILKIIDSITINVDNQYQSSYQQLQLTIIQFDQNSKLNRFLNIIYGNVCENSQAITSEMLLSCNSIGNGILKTGISPSMNFIAQELKDIANNNAITTQEIQLIFQLQFSFINPALLSIQDQMEDILISDIRSFGSFFTSMIALLVCLFVLYDIYLIFIPLRTIEAEIKHTNEMISLMPDNAGQQTGVIPIPEEQ